MYHDQHHPLIVLTSVGDITLPHRASYRCALCHTSTYPLDERLGARQSGRTSRYLQELVDWLLAEEPIAMATETMQKFLGVATPTAIMVGTDQGAESGILIKDGESLERLERVTAVMLDKTGTITQGKPALTDMLVAPGSALDKNTLSQLVAAAENASEHPLARAIVIGAHAQGATLPVATTLAAIPGGGVQAQVEGPLATMSS